MGILAVRAGIRRCYRCLFWQPAGGAGKFWSPSLASTRLWQRRMSRASEIPGQERRQQTIIDDPLSKYGHQVPQLLLSSSIASSDRYLYDLTLDLDVGEKENDVFGMKLRREFRLPSTFDEHIFIGSSHGFLVSIDTAPSPSIHVFDPLTGTHLAPPLPPPPLIHPRMEHELCKTWKTPLEFQRVDSAFLDLYNTKAILSPSLDSIVILSNDRTVSNPVFVAPLSSPSWTKIPNDRGFGEAIFHRGLLHGICDQGVLRVYDIRESEIAKRKANFSMTDPGFKCEYKMQICLVASRDDLFMVFRGADDNNESRFNFRDWETNVCQVFRLTHNLGTRCNEWEEVDSIGGLAFFIGSRSSSLAVDVGREPELYPSLKSNCIYFTDSWRKCSNKWGPDFVGDAGVWSMEHKRVHYIELTGGDGRRLNWPPPVWYMPHPALSSSLPI